MQHTHTHFFEETLSQRKNERLHFFFKYTSRFCSNLMTQDLALLILRSPSMLLILALLHFISSLQRNCPSTVEHVSMLSSEVTCSIILNMVCSLRFVRRNYRFHLSNPKNFHYTKSKIINKRSCFLLQSKILYLNYRRIFISVEV